MKALTVLIIACLLFFGCNNNPEKQSNEHSHSLDGVEHSLSNEKVVPERILDIQTVPMTDFSPEYIQLATNVEIIPDIMNPSKTISVATHEGSFGPLLLGENIWSFFIDLKPGMFLEEHPHSTESLVYTVSGRWVLCSEGKRSIMEAGSLFHFGSNMPTGWEAPFSEGAFILIVKSKPDGLTYESDIESLQDMKNLLDKERAGGVHFYYYELEEDHPAIKFAREVNPYFDDVLKIKY